MDRKLLVNYIYNVLYQVIRIFLSLVLVPYTMGHLTESVIGISDFANSIATWFFLFGVLGIDVYGKREIAKVRDNPEKLSKTFFEILVTQYINMGIALLLYILYTTLFVAENQNIFYLHCITVCIYLFDITWFYFGIENFKVVSLRNILIKAAGVGLMMLLVHEPKDLWLFVIINSGTDVLGHLCTYLGLKKYIHFVPINIKEAYKKHVGATFALFIPTFAINIYTLLDQTMLGVLIADKGEVALYKVAQSFINIFLYFTTSIGSVMLPRIANIYHKEGHSDEVNKFINATFNIALLLGIPMMVAIATVARYFIPWYLPNQLKIVDLFQILCPIILFMSISDVFGMQYLVPTGHNKGFTIASVSGAFISVIANLILIPKLESSGAAISSVITELSVITIQYLFVRKYIKVKGIKTCLKSLIASALMGGVVILIGEALGARLLTNLLQALCGASVYVAALVLMKEEYVLGCITQIKKKLLHS